MIILAALPCRAGVHVTIHADPDHFSKENAAKLLDLIQAVGPQGHKLTILLGADWADAVAAGRKAKQKLRAAVIGGHKVGFHHHDCGHAHPDGYISSDLVPRIGTLCNNGFGAKGTVEDAFASMVGLQQWLTENGVPSTPATDLNLAAQGPNNMNQMRIWEWQPQNIYATGSVDDNDGGLGTTFITFSECKRYGNSGPDDLWDIPEIGHRQLDVGTFDWNEHTLGTFRGEMKRVYDPRGDLYGSGAHLGLVFHAREFDASVSREGAIDNDRDYILAFFDEIERWDQRAVPADELLRQDLPCASNR